MLWIARSEKGDEVTSPIPLSKGRSPFQNYSRDEMTAGSIILLRAKIATRMEMLRYQYFHLSVPGVSEWIQIFRE